MSTVIQINSEGQFIIVGELNFDTVPILYKRGCELIAASPKPIFNLQYITYSDNSGLTLLASLTRYAKAHGKAVIFIHPTQQLLDIIQMSGLYDSLPIVGKEVKENG